MIGSSRFSDQASVMLDALCAAWIIDCVLRLTYLGATNALVVLRLLPTSDRDKGAEILAGRRQIMVLERRLANWSGLLPQAGRG
ncbi:hypothetical protein [Actinoplanes teichomyceticus]|nr:hypothetical protein [Actinoplanes teichomyceticus]